MPTVVGVRLRYSPKVLYFDPADTTPAEGDAVIVETERGTELGTVAQPPHEVEQSALPAPLKPVVRVASEDDLARAAELCQREDEAMRAFRDLVREHGLEMKPVAVEHLFDGAKMVFYFSAEERVDFRTLVRDLANRFKVRIDMRQIGVRDEARIVGGLGHCGEQLCCVRFPDEFQPVSIRMAKEQDLPLNPLKISGLCGRLMCCLRYEYDAYKDFKSRAPKRGAMVETPLGAAKVVELNTPREAVTLRLEDGGALTVPLASMECGKGTGCPCVVRREVLETLRPGVTVPTVPEPGPALEKVPAEEARPRRRSRSKPASKTEASRSQSEQRRTERKVPQSGGDRAQVGDAQGDVKPAVAGRRRRRRRRPPGGGSEGTP